MSNVATQEERAVREPEVESRLRGWVQPQVNIVETKDAYVLEAEMPGVNKEGLEILLEGTELTIIGRRGAVGLEHQPVYRESVDRDYRRTFELDPSIDSGKITARMTDGVLFLELPKAEKVKPRRIKID